MVFKEELKMIKFAFDKVKREIFFLAEKVSRVESQSKKDFDSLKREMEILKLKIVSLEKIDKVTSSHEEQHFLVGNSESKKLHYSNCPYAHKMSKDHIVTFNSLKEALDEGYDRCSCLSD
ncbi:MAG: hypothetical protein PF569_00065 [Candidatus Woesearchaeota archaeon]|jgi:hypothetical protein|nr:hypothetical protein [Candidatus Woesearchaeota archaeon]